MAKRQGGIDLLRMLPAKWVPVGVVVLLCIALIGPALERRWAEKSPAATPDSAATQSPQPNEQATDLTFGVLKQLGQDRYLSPAGLLYTSGSAEGHRLKHIQRHMQDQPDRPGSHGVFYGDMPAVLNRLDDVFTRTTSKEQRTSKRLEDGRTVMEASFSQAIGYVGGQTGGRKGKPETDRIRLVVEGKHVITAFPY